MRCHPLFLVGLLGLIPLSLCADVSVEDDDKNECNDGPQRSSVEFSHREPGGIGYPDGYTSLRYFGATPVASQNSIPFLDLRAHLTNSGKWAGNAGLGWRYFFDRAALGVNAYWDFRDARHSYFQEVGFGLEALFPRWKLWANGYVPIGRLSKKYGTHFDGFEGNYAFFSRKKELPMYGTDAGIGVFMFSNSWFDVEAQAAGYYFQSTRYHKDAAGGLARLKINLSNYIVAEGQVSYDSLFKWNGYGELALRFPLGGSLPRDKKRSLSCSNLIAIEQRLIERPDRFEIMPTTSRKQKTRAIDPATGQPLFFVFVDNTSGSNGTIESPFATLLAAENASSVGNVIYVFPGDGTTTGMSQGITLKNRQRLIGSAVDFEVATAFGNRSIPAQSSQMPKISRVGTTVVLAADDNLISGLHLMNGLIGIDWTLRNNGMASYNRIEDMSVGIQTSQVTGEFRFENNQIVDISGFGIITEGQNNRTTIFNIDSNLIQANISLVDGSFIGTDQVEYHLTRNYTQGRTAGFGFTFDYGFLDGNENVKFFIQDNTLQTTSPSYLIRNNILGAGQTYAELIGNKGDSISATTYDLRNGAANTHTELRLIRNEAVGNKTILIENPANATMRVQSPNLSLSGVEALNSAQFSTSGNITFIPMPD